jgi:Flp pilus assembly protein TadG
MNRSAMVTNRPSTRRTSKSKGQSLAEFALILPIFLTMFGATLDFARLYQAWIALQAATRVAAEYVAMNDTTIVTAQQDARRFICSQTVGVPGFKHGLGVPPANITQCQQPNVTVTAFSRSSTDPGSSGANPIGAATVNATLPFQMFFNYPLLTDNGTWQLNVTESYRVIQGR